MITLDEATLASFVGWALMRCIASWRDILRLSCKRVSCVSNGAVVTQMLSQVLSKPKSSSLIASTAITDWVARVIKISMAWMTYG